MKNFLTHVGVTLLFFIVTAIFFKPEVVDNMQLVAGDTEKCSGMNKEIRDYQDESGKGVTWTGSMFSGMPSYTISTPDGPSNYLFDAAAKVFWFMGGNAGIIFASLFGMYLLLVVMGNGVGISAFGAIAYALSSYFIIILPAGHACKAWAMSYIPFVLLGLFLLFKKNWLWGTVVFAASLSLELRSNHIQITYYLAILCLFLFVAFVIDMLEKKETKNLLIAIGFMFVGVGVAVISNGERLYSNLEMSQVSVRGPSRLSATVDGKTDKSSGLDKDYAFAWSYGAGEMSTLLVPNAYGGASGEELGPESNTVTTLRGKGYNVPDTIQMPTYWGTQPFTSGPVYLGAIVCFLAFFSLVVVKSEYMWAMFLASLFLGVMALGGNASFNDFLFHHLPMYNKFRTPSMALAILQATFALMGCMALKRVADGDCSEKRLKLGFKVALGVTGGLCLVLWLMPEAVLSLEGPKDAMYAQQYGLDPAMFKSMLMADRASLASHDAFRSLIFILLAAGILWFVMKKENRNLMQYAMCAIAVLTLIDLWGVDRRYCNEKNFVEKTNYAPYQKTPADAQILADKDPSYRVLTFDDPFNDTHIPYFHKSIGGYNAAKLRDYQDLIDQHIDSEMQTIATGYNAKHDSVFKETPILNMLNMRYLVINRGEIAIRNNSAFGNAWFVQNYKVTKDTTIGKDHYTAVDMDMKMLGSVDPAKTALLEPDAKAAVEGKTLSYDPSSSITLTSYKPDEVVYKSKSSTPGLVVFSEIYYPKAWTATIDGQPAEHFRADWLLRSMVVPAGEHTIVFTNYASTYWTLRYLASATSAILLLVLIGLIGYKGYKAYKENGEANTKALTKTK